MRYYGREDRVCHETIYNWIYESEYGREEKLFQYLRYARKKRGKLGGRSKHRHKIPNRVSIRERPRIVEEKSQYGHWEADSVVYPNKRAINAMDELSTGLVVFKKLHRKSAALTGVAMVSTLQEYVGTRVTVDNVAVFTMCMRILHNLQK